MKIWFCINCRKIWTEYSEITPEQLISLFISNDDFVFIKMFCVDCAN